MLVAIFFFDQNWGRQASWSTSAELYKTDAAAHPENGRLHFNRGFALAQLRDWNGARDAFTQSVSRYPEFADGHYRLSLVLKNLNEDSKAAQHLEIARRLGLRVP